MSERNGRFVAAVICQQHLDIRRARYLPSRSQITGTRRCWLPLITVRDADPGVDRRTAAALYFLPEGWRKLLNIVRVATGHAVIYCRKSSGGAGDECSWADQVLPEIARNLSYRVSSRQLAILPKDARLWLTLTPLFSGISTAQRSSFRGK